MKIFDDIDRADAAPAFEQESHFHYLNRSARKDMDRVRKLMEEWFSHYQEIHKDELRIRLRSEIDRHFISAFFELYVHEMLIKLGYKIEIHPDVSTKYNNKPDFLVISPSGSEFYMECVLSTDLSDKNVGASKRMDEVYDAINEIESSDFFIGINIRNMPETPVPKGRLKREIINFISLLDPDQVTSSYEITNDLPRKIFSYKDWDLEYFAIPKKKEAREKKSVHPLGARVYMPKWIDTRTPIRNAISRKSTKYGNLDKPFIIAINSLAIHMDNEDIMGALFGQETYLISVDPSVNCEPRMKRKPNGAWHGPNGAQNTRVSAVMIVAGILPWTVAVRTPILYHNPWAQFPCTEILAQLSRYIPKDDRMEAISGLKADQIYNLETKWPS